VSRTVYIREIGARTGHTEFQVTRSAFEDFIDRLFQAIDTSHRRRQLLALKEISAIAPRRLEFNWFTLGADEELARFTLQAIQGRLGTLEAVLRGRELLGLECVLRGTIFPHVEATDTLGANDVLTLCALGDSLERSLAN